MNYVPIKLKFIPKEWLEALTEQDKNLDPRRGQGLRTGQRTAERDIMGVEWEP